MPESVGDRPTRSHEYLFLLSKSRRYFYDRNAIAEPLAGSSITRLSQPTFLGQTGGAKDYGPSSNRSARRALANLHRRHSGNLKRRREPFRLSSVGSSIPWIDRKGARNARTVWTIPVRPFKGAHFATFPPELARRCVAAGCRPGGIVLDPFIGSGTTAVVARQLDRHFIGIDRNAEYVEMARKRVAAEVPPRTPLANEVPQRLPVQLREPRQLNNVEPPLPGLGP